MQGNEESSQASYGFMVVFIVVICEHFTCFVQCNGEKHLCDSFSRFTSWHRYSARIAVHFWVKLFRIKL